MPAFVSVPRSEEARKKGGMNDEWMEKESRDEEGSGIVCG